MKRRTGNHRLNASHSEASRAKPKMEALNRQIKAAVLKGDIATADQLKKELTWLQINTLRLT